MVVEVPCRILYWAVLIASPQVRSVSHLALRPEDLSVLLASYHRSHHSLHVKAEHGASPQAESCEDVMSRSCHLELA